MSEPTKTLGNDELRLLQGKLREKLLAEVRALDPNLVGELTLKFGSASDHFSDWHDRFRDNGTFHDGFGKAGGRLAEIRNTVGPSGAK